MIVISTPFDLPGVTVKVLYEEPFVVALPKNHKLTQKKSIKVDDLVDEILLLLRSGNCFRDQVMEACPACRSDTFSKNSIQKTLEGSSLDTIRQMVAAGSGVTVLPVTSINTEPELDNLLEFRPITKPVPHREVALAYRNSYPRQSLVSLVINTIKDCELEGVNIR